MLHNVTDNKKHNHRILFLHSDLLASDFKKTRISTQPDFSSSSIPENYKIIKILHTISKISTRSSRTLQMTSGNPIQITHQISIPSNEENYQQRFPHWKTEVLTVLTELGLLNYLDGLAGFANHCLGYDDVLTAEQIWMKQDNHIRDWILTLLDPAIMSEEERLHHGKYSSSLWEHLTKKYTPIVQNPHQNSERQEIAEFVAKPYDPTEDKGLGEIAEFLAKPYDPIEDKGLGVPVVPFQPPIVHNPGQNSSGFAPLSHGLFIIQAKISTCFLAKLNTHHSLSHILFTIQANIPTFLLVKLNTHHSLSHGLFIIQAKIPTCLLAELNTHQSLSHGLFPF